MTPVVESLSAVTIVTRDMTAAVRFYVALGFHAVTGGPDAAFTSFAVGGQFLNLIDEGSGPPPTGWGRAIFHVDDVDAIHDLARRQGLTPEFAPRDAPWGERYFHIKDPDGHEISFARPLGQ